MDKITFIYRIWRKIFRNQLDNLLIFTDNNSNGISSMPFRFNRFLTNFYNIDNDIEFFIRNGNSKYIKPYFYVWSSLPKEKTPKQICGKCGKQITLAEADTHKDSISDGICNNCYD